MEMENGHTVLFGHIEHQCGHLRLGINKKAEQDPHLETFAAAKNTFTPLFYRLRNR